MTSHKDIDYDQLPIYRIGWCFEHFHRYLNMVNDFGGGRWTQSRDGVCGVKGCRQWIAWKEREFVGRKDDVRQI